MNPKFQPNSSFSFQRNIAILGILLFLSKIIAWQLTQSNAVFSDALESIVNILAAFMGLFSLYVSSKPKDSEHPFGHGKIEFVSSGIEGALIFFAGIIIIIEALISLVNGKKPHQLDLGIIIVSITAIANYILGAISIRKGNHLNSMVLISSGKHLQTDTITTLGVVLSLVLVALTKWYWLDSVLAIVFGGYILTIAIKIMRNSLKGIMDEADPEIIDKILKVINSHRKPDWVDIHQLRIQQHGSTLLVEGHITLPFYFPIRLAHQKMDEIEEIIRENISRDFEFNFHLDDCKPFSCQICSLSNCEFRKQQFIKKIIWTSENITQSEKHEIYPTPTLPELRKL